MGGLRRKQEKRGCLDGDITSKNKKKRRRLEYESRKQVGSFYSGIGSTCAGLVAQSERKKKRRSKGWRNDRHLNGLLSGEVSSEQEKQSLLAWVELGMNSEHSGDAMMESVGSGERDTNGHSHTHSNGDPNGKGMCFSAHIPHDLKVDGEGSDAFSSKGHSFLHTHTSERPFTGTNGCVPHKHKRKREVDKVLDYVLKRCIVVNSTSVAAKIKPRTIKTVVIAWGRNIPVTLTSEAHAIEEWISSQNGDLFGLDVEWRPNRAKGQRNKVALLQLSNENECLIVQMLFLDRQPQALRKLLSDPSKGLAGVGVLADGKRLLYDYGLECQGGIELTALAVERLKRDELRNVGLKVLAQEVLGLALEKPKRVTLSNWSKEKLDQTQINYACMDAWASFALSKRLLVQT